MIPFKPSRVYRECLEYQRSNVMGIYHYVVSRVLISWSLGRNLDFRQYLIYTISVRENMNHMPSFKNSMINALPRQFVYESGLPLLYPRLNYEFCRALAIEPEKSVDTVLVHRRSDMDHNHDSIQTYPLIPSCSLSRSSFSYLKSSPS